MSTAYEINKGINRTVEFKGIKGQYILYLAVGILLILLLYAILYVIGISTYVCLGIVVPLTLAFILGIQRMSASYGEHGLLKKMAARRLPTSIISKSRKIFIQLKS